MRLGPNLLVLIKKRLLNCFIIEVAQFTASWTRLHVEKWVKFNSSLFQLYIRFLYLGLYALYSRETQLFKPETISEVSLLGNQPNRGFKIASSWHFPEQQITGIEMRVAERSVARVGGLRLLLTLSY